MKFSVIIPVYNVAPFLRACLDSVSRAARGRDDVECIVIDDGSTDGSAEILDGYAARRSPPSCFHAKAFHQANAGVATARNRGLTLATGDWVIFLDADDVIRDTAFSDVEELLTHEPSANLVGYGMMPIEEEGDEPRWQEQQLGIHHEDISRDVGERFAGMSFCEFAYRRDLLEDLRFPRLAVGEDHVFFTSVLARAQNCILTSRKLYGYRYRLNSVTRTKMTLDRMNDLLTAQMEMFRTLCESGKRVAPRFVTCRSYAWLEGIPRQLLSWRNQPGTKELWRRWFDSLRQVGTLPFFDPWIRDWANRLHAHPSVIGARIFLFLKHRRHKRRISPHEIEGCPLEIGQKS